MTDHLDFHQSLIAVLQKITRFAGVNSDDTEQQLTTQPQRHGCLVLSDNCANRGFNIGLKDMGFRELALEISTEPHARERTRLREESLGIKHGCCCCAVATDASVWKRAVIMQRLREERWLFRWRE